MSVRGPALRFALLGALLFAASHWRSAVPPTTDRAVATSSAARSAGDEALLFDIALDAGLDRTDRLVRARLVTLGRYLSLAPETADDEAVERAARSLQLVRSDPIIRRHLVDLMLLTAKSLPPSALPSEAELRNYYAAHAAAYALPPRVRLSHVYVSRDRHGARMAEAAAALAGRLDGADGAAGIGLGDAFARGADIGPASEAELARTFGPPFAAAAMTLPPHRWSAPIASAYGLHIVWIAERVEASAPPFDQVRGQLLHAWLRERRTARLAASLSALHG